ncbi:hypothetical protein EHX26_04265 [Brochothrix thermosphacta]|nr:transposase [Acinetobacter sp.]MPQ28328.1 hypothetical protein [Brochothrix thermosphacta]
MPTRRLHHLKDYFKNYSYEARVFVKTVVVDMNAPYTSLSKDVFPTVIVIIDRFHLVQLVMRSLNQIRIKLMNRYDTTRPEDKKIYRKLKSIGNYYLKTKQSCVIQTTATNVYLKVLKALWASSIIS